MELLVDPYRVVSSIKLKNLNICVFYIDIDELNVILNTNGHRKVDQYYEIDNGEDDDEHEDDKNKKGVELI
jgi:hypothetical protein